jgi:hypothetical protein
MNYFLRGVNFFPSTLRQGEILLFAVKKMLGSGRLQCPKVGPGRDYLGFIVSILDPDQNGRAPWVPGPGEVYGLQTVFAMNWNTGKYPKGWSSEGSSWSLDTCMGKGNVWALPAFLSLFQLDFFAILFVCFTLISYVAFHE